MTRVQVKDGDDLYDLITSINPEAVLLNIKHLHQYKVKIDTRFVEFVSGERQVTEVSIVFEE